MLHKQVYHFMLWAIKYLDLKFNNKSKNLEFSEDLFLCQILKIDVE